MSASWEYRSEVFDFGGFWEPTGEFKSEVFDQKANSLGAQGWELVNVFDTNHRDGNTKYVVAFFKRRMGAL